jgi:hypothetical protein
MERDLVYVSYKDGTVRKEYRITGGRNKNAHSATRISRSILNTSRERLLLILRLAMKNLDLYDKWEKSGKTVKEFIISKRGELTGNKFNF